MITKITGNELSNVYKEYKALLVFSAEWCGACHSLLDTFKKSYSDTQVKVFNIDIGNEDDIVSKLNIKSLPSFSPFNPSMSI